MSDRYSTRLTLLDRAKDQNDSRAWEEFIEFYKNYIYVIIRSMNIHHYEVEDILQQAVIKLWKNLPELTHEPGQSKFRYWVAAVSKNEVLMFIRKQKSLARKMDKAKQESTINCLNSTRLPEIDEIAEKEWKTFITNTALDNIKKHFSERAIEAFILQTKGVSVHEIAEKFDIKEDSVYKYINRVKLRLIDEIEQLKNELIF